MNILIRYLSHDPIQNVVACLKHRFDGVIFYAYKDTTRKKHNLYKVLKNKCGVERFRFIDLDNNNIDSIRKSVSKYKNGKNHYFFDLTGCEGICSAIFINHCSNNDIPLFTIDINKDLELGIINSSKYSLKDVKNNKVKLNIADIISLSGGIIKSCIDDPFKDTSALREFKILTTFKNNHHNEWAYFSSILSIIGKNENQPLSTVELLKKSGNFLDQNSLFQMLSEIKKLGLINNLKFEPVISFDYKNENVKNILIDTGSLFERKIYKEEKIGSDDCLMNVVLDWDGIIRKNQEEDVFNEIDVIKLEGYTLTFISCKDKISSFRKEYIYEIKSVASRFGGRYCKMKIACTNKPSASDYARAKTSGIEIEEYNF